MARDSEKAVLRVVDEAPPKPQEIIKLTKREGVVTRSAPVPMVAPLERLVPEERINEERRTHEPDYEALADTEVAAMPLEETWDDRNRMSTSLPWGWFVLVGLLIGGGIVWSMVHLERHKQIPEAARVEAIHAFGKEEHERLEAEATVNRIVSSVRKYCEAKSIAEMQPFIRQAERVRPLMEDWYRRHPMQTGIFDRLDLFQPVTLDNKGSFWMVTCAMKDKSVRRLLLEELPQGAVGVDWETAVCYQPMDWDEYATQAPRGSFDFRVRIEQDHLFSHEFADAGKWSCYRLTAPQGDEVLYGYVVTQSELGQKLSQMMTQGGNKQMPVLLRISKPTDLKSQRGVVIEKLCSPRWTYVEAPDT